MPFLRFELDAKKKVPAMARLAGIEPGQACWGLLEMWEQCWTEKRETVTVDQLAGLFGCDGAKAGRALIAFGFAEGVADGEFRACGAKRLLGIDEAKKKAGKARIAGSNRDQQGRLLADSLLDHRPAAAGEPSSTGPALTPSTQHPTPNTQKEEEEEQQAASPLPSLPEKETHSLQKLWNELACEELPRWIETGKERARAVKARLKERPDIHEWRVVLKRVNASSFLRGHNDRGWRASPDWLLRPESATKVLEGKYDDAPEREAPPPAVQSYVGPVAPYEPAATGLCVTCGAPGGFLFGGRELCLVHYREAIAVSMGASQ